MFETFLFLYDVLWLESTTLLFIGSPFMSLLDMMLLFFLNTSCSIHGGHYAVGWDGAVLFSVSSGLSVVSSPLYRLRKSCKRWSLA